MPARGVPSLVMAVALCSVAACHGSSPAATSSPSRLCQAALAHRTISSASTTTVGDVRALSGGPAGAGVATTAFRGAKSSDPAAWCWVSSGLHSWTAYAAGPRHQSIRVASYDGLTTPPSGAPSIK